MKISLKQIVESNAQLLVEKTGTLGEIGIPKAFSAYLLRVYKIPNTVQVEKLTGKPKIKDIEQGSLIVNVKSDDEIIAFSKHHYWDAFAKKNHSKDSFFRLVSKNGTVKQSHEKSVPAAAKDMDFSSPTYRVKVESFGDKAFRTKNFGEDPKAKLTSDPLAGSPDKIYDYMNKTFMPKIRVKLETMVDSIYANLRKLNKDERNGVYSDQKDALNVAKALEDIIENGFDKGTMERFLQSANRYHSGFGSIPANQRELADLLKKDPLARAKWAKTLIDYANQWYKQFTSILNKKQ